MVSTEYGNLGVIYTSCYLYFTPIFCDAEVEGYQHAEHLSIQFQQ